VPEASPPGLPLPPVAKAGFLWRMVERRRTQAQAPLHPSARPALHNPAVQPAVQPSGAAAWVQLHGRAQPGDGRSVFVIGPVGDAAVRRFARALNGQGWSVDLCDDAEAAVASIAASPRRWHMVALFACATGAGPAGDEAWSDLSEAAPALPMLRFHRQGMTVRRIDVRNMRAVPRPFPVAAAGR